MAYTIFFVLHNTDELPRLLSAWHNLGIHCRSVMNSTTYDHQQPPHRIPMRFSINPTLTASEKDTLSLFAFASDLDQVKQCLEASQEILGELERDDSGYLPAWQLAYPSSKQ